RLRIVDAGDVLRAKISATHISVEVFFEFGDSYAKRIFDCFCNTLTSAHLLQESLELFLAPALAEHQVMYEGPRLTVEDPAFVLLVVVWRVGADRKESVEWQQFVIAQEVNVGIERRTE